MAETKERPPMVFCFRCGQQYKRSIDQTKYKTMYCLECQLNMHQGHEFNEEINLFSHYSIQKGYRIEEGFRMIRDDYTVVDSYSDINDRYID